MSMNTKCYDIANERAGDLKRALYRRFTADGHIDAEEANLLHMADEVCLADKVVATRIRFAVRGLGGGKCHKSLRYEARSLVQQADELEALSQGIEAQESDPQRRALEIA